MASIGLLTAGSDAQKTVRERLADRARLKAARVHPIQVLLALAMYGGGQGMRGALSWTPAPAVLDALDAAFYAAFDDIVPAGPDRSYADMVEYLRWEEALGKKYEHA